MSVTALTAAQKDALNGTVPGGPFGQKSEDLAIGTKIDAMITQINSNEDALTGGTGLTVTINSDAVAGTNEDPGLVLAGGDGGSEIIKTSLRQDSSADVVTFSTAGGAAGATVKTTNVGIGAPGETTASVDATLTLNAATDAAAAKSATITLLGQENDLVITGPSGGAISAATNLDAEAGLDVSGGGLTVAAGQTLTVGQGATAAADTDPTIVLIGGDGVAAPNNDLVTSTLTQDTTLDILKYTVTKSRNGGGAARISPVFQIGQPAETVAGLDASIVMGASQDDGTAKSLTMQYKGQEQELLVSGDGSFSTTMNLNAQNGLDVSGAALTVDNTREISYRRLCKVVINAVGGSGGATAGTMDVDVQTLDGVNVSGIKRIKILASLTAPNPHALLATLTFASASAGTIIATGNGYVVADTDASGNFTCVPSDSADETVFFWAESFPGVGSAGQGCVVVECIAGQATWAA